MATEKEISITRGRRWAFSGTVVKNGSGFNLTGYTVKLEAKYEKKDTTLAIEKKLTPDPDQGANPGDYTGVLLPSETIVLIEPIYYYEINIYDATGDFIYRPVYGRLTIDIPVDDDPTD